MTTTVSYMRFGTRWRRLARARPGLALELAPELLASDTLGGRHGPLGGPTEARAVAEISPRAAIRLSAAASRAGGDGDDDGAGPAAQVRLG
jgi:hypothetical protein